MTAINEKKSKAAANRASQVVSSNNSPKIDTIENSKSDYSDSKSKNKRYVYFIQILTFYFFYYFSLKTILFI